MARLAFCSNDYPCNCHNVLCMPVCWMTLGCCKNMCLETYDQSNRRDLKKMSKQQVQANAAAPQPHVMVATPAPVSAAPGYAQPVAMPLPSYAQP